MKGEIALGFSLHLLLLMLHFKLSLKLPLLLLIQEFIHISLLTVGIDFWFESRLVLIRVLFKDFLVNLSLFNAVLYLLIADYLFVSFMNGNILSLFLDDLNRFLIDLRLLSQFLELFFGT